MTEYYRVMLRRKSVHAATCLAEGFIGVDDEFGEDLKGHLADDWRSFNKYWVPKLMQKHPERSKISIGPWCGYTWTVCKGIAQGDTFLCPDGAGSYRVGDVTGDYSYHPGEVLRQRRSVTWCPVSISNSGMTDGLPS